MISRNRLLPALPELLEARRLFPLLAELVRLAPHASSISGNRLAPTWPLPIV